MVNKEKYKIGNKYKFSVAGLALSFEKRADLLEGTTVDGEKMDMSEAVGFVNNGEIANYALLFMPFDGKIEKFKEFGINYFKFNFDQTSIEFPIYVSSPVLQNYIPKKNEPLEAYVWLQGYLVD